MAWGGGGAMLQYLPRQVSRRKPCFPTKIVTDGETMAEVIK